MTRTRQPVANIQALSDKPLRTLLWLAVPVLLEQILVFSVGLVDVWLSGRISSQATEAVGVAAYVGWMASMLFSLVGIGTSALVARAWGAGNHDGARELASRGAGLALLIGLGVCLLLQSLSPTLVWFLGLGADSTTIALPYLRIDALSQIFIAITLFCSAALRGTGDMITPLMVLSLTNFINIVMSTLCVYGMGPLQPMGVNGIATGTLIAQVCSASLMLFVLLTRRRGLWLVRSQLLPDRISTSRILSVGGPAALEGMCRFAGHFLFLKIVAGLPHAGSLAAHTIDVRLEAISYLPAMACGIAAASLVGQSLGAGRPDLARRMGHTACLCALIYSVLTTALYWWGAESLVGVMHQDPIVREVAIPALRLMAAYQLINAAAIVYSSCLRGAGDTVFPLWAAIFGALCLRVPISYLAGHWLDGGLTGAWLGMGADNLLIATLATWRFCGGRWARALSP